MNLRMTLSLDCLLLGPRLIHNMEPDDGAAPARARSSRRLKFGNVVVFLDWTRVSIGEGVDAASYCVLLLECTSYVSGAWLPSNT